jgi:hypothetical protein
MSCAVTVVIPVLNEAAALPRLLAALKAQTLRPREVLIADAGSTDGSAAAIEQWWRAERWDGGDCRVLAVPGAMPGAGRNAGVRAAVHEWIAFLDAGIDPEPTWLERLCAYAQSRNVRAVFGLCRFAAAGAFERAVCALSHGQGTAHSVVPASLFHRRVFDEIGWFPEHLRAAEDLNWSDRLTARYGPREICADAVVHYTHFPTSWLSALRKWKLAEYASVLAGVRLPQQRLSLIGLPLVYGALFSGTVVGFGVFMLYLVGRGVIDPLRRSSERPWWGKHLGSFLIAPGLAAALDLAKLTGIVQAYLNWVMQVRKVRVCG